MIELDQISIGLGQSNLTLLQVLFGGGDALAQQAVDRRGWAKHDLARTGRMAIYGGGRSFNLVTSLGSPFSWH